MERISIGTARRDHDASNFVKLDFSSGDGGAVIVKAMAYSDMVRVDQWFEKCENKAIGVSAWNILYGQARKFKSLHKMLRVPVILKELLDAGVLKDEWGDPIGADQINLGP